MRILDLAILGNLSISASLEYTIDCEIGLNLNNSEVFPLIGHRLSEMEAIEAEEVNIDMTNVKKIDSRGSIITNLQSIPNLNNI